MKFTPSFKLLILNKAAACTTNRELEYSIGSNGQNSDRARCTAVIGELVWRCPSDSGKCVLGNRAGDAIGTVIRTRTCLKSSFIIETENKEVSVSIVFLDTPKIGKLIEEGDLNGNQKECM